ncbi:hypothetical protein AND_005364 [Anopheles darlingi]|uniref:Uncharacterized protein n=1 Tax=Anopheles darlingi TaxID=43151 RepID=W5JJ72_ANODA|nr:hypothetical protein AND_005364 [Anopheles darlingi]
MVENYIGTMCKFSVTLLVIGLALVVVWTGTSHGSSLSRESSESNESNDSTDMETKLREQCIENTGSYLTYEIFRKSLDKFYSCAPMHLGSRFEEDFILLTNATRETFFSEYCPRVRPIVSCLEESLMGMQPCLKQGTLQIVAAFVRSISEAVALACKNDGEIMFQLKNEKHQTCMNDKADDIAHAIFTLTMSLKDVSELREDHCRELNYARQSIKFLLGACELSDILKVLDVPINAMFGVMPCANLTEEQMGIWMDMPTFVDDVGDDFEMHIFKQI